MQTSRCPRCGRDNSCAIAADQTGTACWCSAVVVPPATLAMLPPAARGSACLCSDCLLLAGASGVLPTQDPGGRPAWLLRRGEQQALVAQCGAQLLRYSDGAAELLWTAGAASYAAGKPVRAGIPLVFPWFGDHPSERQHPAHGFARNLDWQLTAASAAPQLVLRAGSNPWTRSLWPHDFALELTIGLDEAGLSLAWAVSNLDPQPLRCELALHSYFPVGDVSTASLHGLAGCAYSEHAAAPAEGVDPAAPIDFRAETDRIYQDAPALLELQAPALRRRLAIRTEACASTIVWTPWPAKAARLPQLLPTDWRQFVCVESGNVRQRAWQLAPGEQRLLRCRIHGSAMA